MEAHPHITLEVTFQDNVNGEDIFLKGYFIFEVKNHTITVRETSLPSKTNEFEEDEGLRGFKICTNVEGNQGVTKCLLCPCLLPKARSQQDLLDRKQQDGGTVQCSCCMYGDFSKHTEYKDFQSMSYPSLSSETALAQKDPRSPCKCDTTKRDPELPEQIDKLLKETYELELELEKSCKEPSVPKEQIFQEAPKSKCPCGCARADAEKLLEQIDRFPQPNYAAPESKCRCGCAGADVGKLPEQIDRLPQPTYAAPESKCPCGCAGADVAKLPEQIDRLPQPTSAAPEIKCACGCARGDAAKLPEQIDRLPQPTFAAPESKCPCGCARADAAKLPEQIDKLPQPTPAVSKSKCRCEDCARALAPELPEQIDKLPQPTYAVSKRKCPCGGCARAVAAALPEQIDGLPEHTFMMPPEERSYKQPSAPPADMLQEDPKQVACLCPECSQIVQGASPRQIHPDDAQSKERLQPRVPIISTSLEEQRFLGSCRCPTPVQTQQTPKKQQSKERIPKKQQSKQQTPGKQPSQQQSRVKQQSKQQLLRKQQSRPQTAGKQQSHQQIPKKQQSQQQTPTKQQPQLQTTVKQQSKQQIPGKQPSQQQTSLKQQSKQQIPRKQQSQQQAHGKQQCKQQIPEKQSSQHQTPVKQQSKRQIPRKQQSQQQALVKQQSHLQTPKKQQPRQQQAPVKPSQEQQTPRKHHFIASPTQIKSPLIDALSQEIFTTPQQTVQQVPRYVQTPLRPSPETPQEADRAFMATPTQIESPQAGSRFQTLDSVLSTSVEEEQPSLELARAPLTTSTPRQVTQPSVGRDPRQTSLRSPPETPQEADRAFIASPTQIESPQTGARRPNCTCVECSNGRAERPVKKVNFADSEYNEPPSQLAEHHLDLHDINLSRPEQSIEVTEPISPATDGRAEADSSEQTPTGIPNTGRDLYDQTPADVRTFVISSPQPETPPSAERGFIPTSNQVESPQYQAEFDDQISPTEFKKPLASSTPKRLSLQTDVDEELGPIQQIPELPGTSNQVDQPEPQGAFDKAQFQDLVLYDLINEVCDLHRLNQQPSVEESKQGSFHEESEVGPLKALKELENQRMNELRKHAERLYSTKYKKEELDSFRNIVEKRRTDSRKGNNMDHFLDDSNFYKYINRSVRDLQADEQKAGKSPSGNAGAGFPRNNSEQSRRKSSWIQRSSDFLRDSANSIKLKLGFHRSDKTPRNEVKRHTRLHFASQTSDSTYTSGYLM